MVRLRPTIFLLASLVSLVVARRPGWGQLQFLTAEDHSEVVVTQHLDPIVPGPYEEFGDALPPPPPESESGLPAQLPGSEPLVNGPLLSESIGDEFGLPPVYSDELGYSIPPGEAPVQVYSTGTLYWNGRWYTQQEVSVMVRGEVQDRVLAREVIDNNFNLGRESLALSAAPFHYRAGLRFTLGRILRIDSTNRQHALEFGFHGLFDWSNEYDYTGRLNDNNVVSVLAGDPNTAPEQAVAPGDQFAPLTGFFLTDRHSIRVGSRLNNYEVNYRLLGRPSRDRMALQPDGTWVRYAASSQIRSAFAGFRFVQMDESILYQSQRLDPTVAGGAFDVQLDNFLAGMQLGAQFTDRHHNWSWGMRGKVGALVNWAERTSRIEAFDNSTDPVGSLSDQEVVDDQHLAFLAEGGFFAAYEIRPNAAIRFSFDAMYLTGLATIAPNISFPGGFSPLNVGGDALYHGVSLGFEQIW